MLKPTRRRFPHGWSGSGTNLFPYPSHCVPRVHPLTAALPHSAREVQPVPLRSTQLILRFKTLLGRIVEPAFPVAATAAHLMRFAKDMEPTGTYIPPTHVCGGYPVVKFDELDPDTPLTHTGLHSGSNVTVTRQVREGAEPHAPAQSVSDAATAGVPTTAEQRNEQYRRRRAENEAKRKERDDARKAALLAFKDDRKTQQLKQEIEDAVKRDASGGSGAGAGAGAGSGFALFDVPVRKAASDGDDDGSRS